MKLYKTQFRAAAVAAAMVSSLALGASANAAAIIGLYNTGVDASGTPLPDGAIDTHYTLNGSGSPYVYTNPLYLTDPNAKFISAQPDGGYTSPSNLYSLTFTLDAADVATAFLSGATAADNGVTVLLNGQVLQTYASPTDYSAFQTLHPFSAPAGSGLFLEGLNTLSFTTTDFGRPSAVLVTNLQGFTSAVPEPASWAMMIGGFGMVAGSMRAKRARARVSFAA